MVKTVRGEITPGPTVKEVKVERPAGGSGKALLFEANVGQTGKEARFIARNAGAPVYLTDSGAVFSLQSAARTEAVTMSFSGAKRTAAVGEMRAVTKTNYYTGQKRFENIANFKKVSYKNIYDRIDAVFYGNDSGQFEYDFVVAPGADADKIRLKFDGAQRLQIDSGGNLVIDTAHAQLVQHKPYAYQEIDGQRKEVTGNYEILGKNEVKFTLGSYDGAKTLVIDPVVKYLTYLGGGESDFGEDITADKDGNAYIVSSVSSLDFPVANSRQSGNETAISVTKLDPTGSTIIFNTFLDGRDSDGVGDGAIALGPDNSVFIASSVRSRNYPVTQNSFQPRKSICPYASVTCILVNEGVVTKLTAAGTIAYSTYLGGPLDENLSDIAVDSAGRAFVVGRTNSGVGFPKKNEFQSTGFFGAGANGFLTVFNPDGTDIDYSTALGGNSSDSIEGIALDSSGKAYVVGETDSNGTFPVRSAFQAENGGARDAFAAKFDTSLAGDPSLIYSTFLGGSGGDAARAVAVDANGAAYVTGLTGSVNFPLRNAFRSTNQVNEAFVCVIGAAGNSLQNSSFLGGIDQEEGRSIEIGNGGLIYVAGTTNSANFPVSQAFQPVKSVGRDAFITKLRFGAGVIASSFAGGNGEEELDVGLAVRGNLIYLAGTTNSNDLATTDGALKEISNATNKLEDGFVVKMLDTNVDSVGNFIAPISFQVTQSTSDIIPQTLPFTSFLSGQLGVAGDWNGDGIDNVGSFSNGVWKTRNVNFPVTVVAPNFGVTKFNFGTTGDLPVTGDWDGDGIDTAGIFQPALGQFIVTDTVGNPSIIRDVTKVTFGTAGDLPIAGDWDGDGKDSIAVYRPGTGQTFFTNEDISVKASTPVTLTPAIDFIAFLGIAEDLPTAGDWNGDGLDTLGLRRPSTAQFFLSDDNVTLRPPFFFGRNEDQPHAGDWDGKPNP